MPYRSYTAQAHARILPASLLHIAAQVYEKAMGDGSDMVYTSAMYRVYAVAGCQGRNIFNADAKRKLNWSHCVIPVMMHISSGHMLSLLLFIEMLVPLYQHSAFPHSGSSCLLHSLLLVIPYFHGSVIPPSTAYFSSLLKSRSGHKNGERGSNETCVY